MISIHPSIGTILCAERWCCLNSLLGYWAQSWMGRLYKTPWIMFAKDVSDCQQVFSSRTNARKPECDVKHFITYRCEDLKFQGFRLHMLHVNTSVHHHDDVYHDDDFKDAGNNDHDAIADHHGCHKHGVHDDDDNDNDDDMPDVCLGRIQQQHRWKAQNCNSLSPTHLEVAPYNDF